MVQPYRDETFNEVRDGFIQDDGTHRGDVA